MALPALLASTPGGPPPSTGEVVTGEGWEARQSSAGLRQRQVANRSSRQRASRLFVLAAPSLLLALGEELTGQSHHEWEEQRLNKIIEDAERDREKVRRLREKSALVRERADRVAAALHWQEPEEGQRLAP